MSAFIVEKAHIDALLDVAMHGPGCDGWRVQHFSLVWCLGESPAQDENGYRKLTAGNANKVGQMLVDECVRSVSDRYPDNDSLPGPTDAYWRREYRFSYSANRPSALEALKLIACYEYQSCEHAGWERSEAAAFCSALKANLITELPGYDDAPWEWTTDEPQLEQREG